MVTHKKTQSPAWSTAKVAESPGTDNKNAGKLNFGTKKSESRMALSGPAALAYVVIKGKTLDVAVFNLDVEDVLLVGLDALVVLT